MGGEKAQCCPLDTVTHDLNVSGTPFIPNTPLPPQPPQNPIIFLHDENPEFPGNPVPYGTAGPSNPDAIHPVPQIPQDVIPPRETHGMPEVDDHTGGNYMAYVPTEQHQLLNPQSDVGRRRGENGDMSDSF
jgi:hypothetical protein